jgi:homoserine kinase
MRWPTGPVTVIAPATSANLGPGFDSLGLALSLHDTLEARVSPGDSEVTIHGITPDAGAEANLILRAMAAGFTAMGAQPPGLAITCRNVVPQGFGLGSSAAAIVAGLIAARELTARRGGGTLPDQELLSLASDLEGHPDNVAACLAGGLTIAWDTASGVRSARLATLTELRPVLCLPAIPLATRAARMVLPARVPHADAVANSARAALLIAALTADPDLLLAGTEDFLHQPYRAGAMPATAALIARLREAGIAAVVSGAGPAVLALTIAGRPPGAAEVSAIAAGPGPVWKVMPLDVDTEGARVTDSPQDLR